MTPSARVQAAIDILDQVIVAARDNGPAADTLVAGWFRMRRFAGSKDRAAIRQLVYRTIRAFGDPPENGRMAMVGLARDDGDLAVLFDGSNYGPAALDPDEPSAPMGPVPAAIAAMIPGTEHHALIGRAPFDLRVNLLKATRGEILNALPGSVAIDGTEAGVRLPDNFDLATRPDLSGLIDVQDAGSQMIAQACLATPGSTVIDLCAGAGGKSLALASLMGNQGQIIACDTNRARLQKLEPRGRLAGATIVETRLLNPKRETEMLADMTQRADCVLVDAPCSGSGTWRRNPELRWRLAFQGAAREVALQSYLLDLGATLVRPGGALVYAVCSVLPIEAIEQIDRFLARNASFSIELSRQLTPARDGTDGFYFARLRRSC
jgi:16S rRNA (cytosine967-C5)-methyltransferase